MKSIRTILRRGWKEESGQALLLAAVCMVGLLAFTGLAIDVGQLRHAHRELQSAADASAIAGALELNYCGSNANCTVMQTAAKQALVENGISGATLLTQCATSSTTGPTLTLNNGPCALGSTAKDPNYGKSQFVEAVVSKRQSTFFAGVIGIGSLKISARAEATMGNSPYCLYIGKGGLTINSGSHITLSCGIIDDGSLMANNGAHVNATAFNVVGGITLNGNSNGLSPQPTSTSMALPDPLNWVQQQTPPVNSCSSYLTVDGNMSIDANAFNASYCGINVNKGTLTLTPSSSGNGTFVFQGNVNIDSGANLKGSGITLYFHSGTMQANSGSDVNLVAPTTGPMAGILLYQDPSDTSQMTMDSGSKSTWQGAIYLPGGTLEMDSGGNLAAYTIIYAYQVMVNSGAKIDVAADYSSLPDGSPAKATTAVLAE